MNTDKMIIEEFGSQQVIPPNIPKPERKTQIKCVQEELDELFWKPSSNVKEVTALKNKNWISQIWHSFGKNKKFYITMHFPNNTKKNIIVDGRNGMTFEFKDGAKGTYAIIEEDAVYNVTQGMMELEYHSECMFPIHPEITLKTIITDTVRGEFKAAQINIASLSPQVFIDLAKGAYAHIILAGEKLGKKWDQLWWMAVVNIIIGLINVGLIFNKFYKGGG